MSITEINRNRASKKKTDEALQVRALQETMSSIKRKFLVMSSQAGVGKTSVIVNLAMALSRRGVKVGLMDANFHGPDIQRMLGLEPEVASNLDKQFLGRIPIDPHFVECDDAGGPFLEKYAESEVVEACNLIVDKIMGGERK